MNELIESDFYLYKRKYDHYVFYMKKDAFSDILQTACSFASEIISFIPDPESGKAGKTPPTHPPTSTPKPNAGQAGNFIYTYSASVYCKLLVDLKAQWIKRMSVLIAREGQRSRKCFCCLMWH